MKQRLGLFIILIVMIGLFGSKRYAQGMDVSSNVITSHAEQLRRIDEEIAQKEQELADAGMFQEFDVVRRLADLKTQRDALENLIIDLLQQQRMPIPADDCRTYLRAKFIELIYSKNLVFLPDAGYPVAWSPDGSKMVTRFRGHRGGIWNAANGVRLHTLQQQHRFERVAWSSDGSKIATTSWSHHTVEIWDAATGAILHVLQHQDNVRLIEWSPDGSRIATGSGGVVEIWDAATGAMLHAMQHQNSNAIKLATWSPDGSKIAIGSFFYNTVEIYDTTTGTSLHTLQQEGSISLVAWSPDASKITTASDNYTGIIWDAATGMRLHTLQKAGLAVWSPSGDKIATASDGYGAVIWNAATGARLHTLRHQRNASYIVWSPDERKIVTLSYDRTVGIWDVATGVRLHTLSNVFSAVCNPDVSKIAIRLWGKPKTLEIWDVATGMQLNTLSYQDHVRASRWSPDGRNVAIVSDQDGVKIYNIEAVNKIKKVIELPTIDQCDLLRAIDMAMQETGRIQATIEQWQTFTGFPQGIQDALRLYIKPPESLDHTHRYLEAEPRLNRERQEREKKRKEREEEARIQEPAEPEQSDRNDDDDDNDGAPYRGKEKMRRTQE